MNIIVIGCGRVGSDLAYRLSKKGHRVVVVDQEAASFKNLPADFHGRTVEGEVLAQDVLRRAGIEQAGGLAAVTNSDSLNAAVAHVARTVYGVPNVVARNYDPHQRTLHEIFDLQVIGSASWGAQRLEELLSNTALRAVFSAGNGEVEVYELLVPAAWNERPLEELLIAGQCWPVAVTRAGRALPPVPNTRLAAGDVLHVSATLEGIEALQQRLERDTKDADQR